MNNEFILTHSEATSEEEAFEEKFYCYDNFSFLSDVIIELIRLNENNYITLGDLILLSRKLFRKITIKNSDYFLLFNKTFNERISELLKETKNVNHINNNNTKSSLQNILEENKTMNYFIYCYFDFMGELYTTDAYFFNLAKDAKIMKDKQFESFFEKLAEKQFNKVPIEVEYGICRYYLAIKNPLNFNFNSISDALKNLYMKNVKDNMNILHLGRKVPKDIGVSKTIELLDYGRELNLIYSLFNKDRLKSYYNPKDLRFMFKYFENIIVRPLFSVFNMYIIDIEQARGKDISVFHKIVFKFLQICYKFYKCPKFETKSKVSDKIVYGFEEFIVKHELTNSVLEDIYNLITIYGLDTVRFS